MYGDNLQAIYRSLAQKADKVMWTTTTPCPDVVTSYGRSYLLVEEYNAQALKSLGAVAGSAGLLVDDLWKSMVGFCGDHYKECSLQLPANVHLTPAGENFLAAEAAKSILAALGM